MVWFLISTFSSAETQRLIVIKCLPPGFCCLCLAPFLDTGGWPLSHLKKTLGGRGRREEAVPRFTWLTPTQAFCLDSSSHGTPSRVPVDRAGVLAHGPPGSRVLPPAQRQTPQIATRYVPAQLPLEHQLHEGRGWVSLLTVFPWGLQSSWNPGDVSCSLA